MCSSWDHWGFRQYIRFKVKIRKRFEIFLFHLTLSQWLYLRLKLEGSNIAELSLKHEAYLINQGTRPDCHIVYCILARHLKSVCSYSVSLFIHEGLAMRLWSLACVARSCARESGRHGMKKIGLPRPSHRLLCLRSRVGGSGDWVLCTCRWKRMIKNWLTLFFFLMYEYESIFNAKECTLCPPWTSFCTLWLFCVHELAVLLEIWRVWMLRRHWILQGVWLLMCLQHWTMNIKHIIFAFHPTIS